MDLQNCFGMDNDFKQPGGVNYTGLKGLSNIAVLQDVTAYD